MQTPFDFGQDEGKIVYVKTVDVADLPTEVQENAGDLEQLYSVHNAQGEQLALVADRRMAFVLARQHDLAPVAVH
ncbi:MAG: DUF1150 family protein [Paracoccaceae bacterium]